MIKKIKPWQYIIIILGILFILGSCSTLTKENINQEPQINHSSNLNKEENIVPYTLEQCKELDTINLTFKNINSLCKSEQIITCKNLELGPYGEQITKKSICLLNLAGNYNDANLCEHITNLEVSQIQTDRKYDIYWLCVASLRYGQSACNHIKNDAILRRCFEINKK